MEQLKQLLEADDGEEGGDEGDPGETEEGGTAGLLSDVKALVETAQAKNGAGLLGDLRALVTKHDGRRDPGVGAGSGGQAQGKANQQVGTDPWGKEDPWSKALQNTGAGGQVAQAQGREGIAHSACAERACS